MAMHFDLLKEFINQGPLTVRVTGLCMDAVISPDSDLRLENSNRYYPGDIIAFKRGNGELVSHRFLGYVLGRSGWRVITRADNAGRADAPAAIRNVLGRVTHVNGKPHKPGLRIRIRAFADWTFAVPRWAVSRLVVSLDRVVAR